MTRLILATLLLSACAVPDDCYTRRDDVRDCIERQRDDPRVECECQDAKSSGSLAPVVRGVTPDKEEPLREPPGEGKDRPGYREWVDAGRPKP